MPAKPRCSDVKKVAADIRKRLRGAVNDLKKSQPRSASTKLFQAKDILAANPKAFKNKKLAKAIREDAHYVSMKLVNQSTMHWPKWQDRTKAMLASFEKITETLPACK